MKLFNVMAAATIVGISLTAVACIIILQTKQNSNLISPAINTKEKQPLTANNTQKISNNGQANSHPNSPEEFLNFANNTRIRVMTM